jgi:hypothetical protein
MTDAAGQGEAVDESGDHQGVSKGGEATFELRTRVSNVAERSEWHSWGAGEAKALAAEIKQRWECEASDV